MIRAVIDTNIIVSALFWGGLPGKVFVAARDELFIALLTEQLITELATVIGRDKFAEQLSKRNLTVETIIGQYRSAAVLVEPAEIPTGIVRDPKDHAVLACAVGGKADLIVSGDNDLLALAAYENIPILNVDQFLKRLSSA
jgi:putative PIN family toxin of toxin-antitoxin system